MPNNYAPALRALGIKTVSGDIPGTMHFAPDVIINRSLLKRRLQGYAGKPSKVYAGPDYMILDNAFAKSHGRKRVIRHPVRNILLTFGGSDVMNLTPKVLRALERVQTNAGITVVLGSAYAHRHALQQVLARLKRQVCIVQDVNNLSELMMQADVAIASGGRTLYELACTGTPALILCAEPEQLVNLQEFQGIVEGLGLGRKVPMSTLARAITRLLENPQVRASMSKKGKELVDGKGLERVVKIIAQLLGTGS
jgi:spore coat polysaccharide biosynthesis predicted glycosyltransferase SpsG